MKLIQLIGPQMSGKTTLCRMLAPQAVDISGCLNGFFNQVMLNNKHGFFFQEAPNKRGIQNLENWLNSRVFRVERQGQEPITVMTPELWIYEGFRPIQGNFETLIWRIERGS